MLDKSDYTERMSCAIIRHQEAMGVRLIADIKRRLETGEIPLSTVKGTVLAQGLEHIQDVHPYMRWTFLNNLLNSRQVVREDKKRISLGRYL